MSLIEFKNVTFAYPKSGQAKTSASAQASTSPNNQAALQNINLNIEAGEFVCILGANGSGKSTLAQHINALLLPSEGEVYIDGMNTQEKPHLRKIRQKAGMVFQNPENQAVASVVEDDVAFGPENLGLEPQVIRERVADALETVHMSDKAKSEIFDLSGGEKQRVAIAGILAMKPDILIMDEPNAMLDERGKRGIMRVAHELHDKGITIVMITHNMDDATAADRVIVLSKGKIVFQGSPASVFCLENAAELRRINLGMPRASELAMQLSEQGVSLDKLPLSTEELVSDIVKLINK